ncbi:hypothetical protein JS561_09550 [Salmonella enterica subsp. enterica serovar Infantis]|nr:hypothetical protein JS561_09550 [Salmonella enterica subsp. enterica serovar Infantis]
MEAFELDIYASEYNELAFTLHKRKFLVEPEDELHLSLDDTCVWFNIDNRRLKARRKLDARDSKLDFFVSAAAMVNAGPIPITWS